MRSAAPRPDRSRRTWRPSSSCPSSPWRGGTLLLRRALMRGGGGVVGVDREALLLARHGRGLGDLVDELGDLAVERVQAVDEPRLAVDRLELSGEPVDALLEAIDRLLDPLQARGDRPQPAREPVDVGR